MIESSLVVFPAPLDPTACVASVPTRAAAGSFAFASVAARDSHGNPLPASSLRESLRAHLVPASSATGAGGEYGHRGGEAAGLDGGEVEVLLHGAAQAAADANATFASPVSSSSAASSGACIAFRCTRAGWFSLHVYAGGVSKGQHASSRTAEAAEAQDEVTGSPFNVLIEPAETHAHSCDIYLRPVLPQVIGGSGGGSGNLPPPLPTDSAPAGTTGGAGGAPSGLDDQPKTPFLFAGQPAHAVVHARDRYGNARASGGDAVRLLLRTPRRVLEASVSDPNDGTYTCALLPTDAGSAMLSLSVNGVQVPLPTILPSSESVGARQASSASHRPFSSGGSSGSSGRSGGGALGLRPLPTSLQPAGHTTVRVLPARASSLDLYVTTASLSTAPSSGAASSADSFSTVTAADAFAAALHSAASAAAAAARSTAVVAARGVALHVHVTAYDAYGNTCAAFPITATASYEDDERYESEAPAGAEEAVDVQQATTDASDAAVASSMAPDAPASYNSPCAVVSVTPRYEGKLRLGVRCGALCEEAQPFVVINPHSGARKARYLVSAFFSMPE